MPETGGIAIADAEENDLSDFTGTKQDAGNVIAASTDRILHGNYSYKLSFAGSDKDVAGWIDFAAKTEVYARMYFNVDVVDWANAEYLEDFLGLHDVNEAGATLISVRLYRIDASNMGYRLYVTDNAGTAYKIDQRSVSNFVPDQTYLIEIHWKQGNGDGEWGFWIDGDLKGSGNTETNDNYDIQTVKVGNTTGVIPGNTCVLYIDDLKVDTSYIGAYSAPAGGIVVLRRRRM